MTRSQFTAEIDSPVGPVKVTFHNDPMLSAEVSRAEPFFQTLMARWNRCLVEETDPHERLQQTVSPERELSLEEQRKFVQDFLYAAATATRELQEGQDAACASLEHHAEQLHPE